MPVSSFGPVGEPRNYKQKRRLAIAATAVWDKELPQIRVVTSPEDVACPRDAQG
jgi:hypothetical protein